MSADEQGFDPDPDRDPERGPDRRSERAGEREDAGAGAGDHPGWGDVGVPPFPGPAEPPGPIARYGPRTEGPSAPAPAGRVPGPRPEAGRPGVPPSEPGHPRPRLQPRVPSGPRPGPDFGRSERVGGGSGMGGADSGGDSARRLFGLLQQDLVELQRRMDILSAEVRSRETTLRLSTAETRLKSAENALAELDGLPRRLAADLGAKVDAAERAATEREATARIKEAAARQAAFAEQNDRLEAELDRFRSQAAELARRVSGYEARLRETTRRMDRLEPRLEWLERTGRIRSGAHEVDLDHPDDTVLSLRDTIHTGRRTADDLLDDPARERAAADVERHQRAWHAAHERVADAVTAAGVLATAPGADSPRPAGRYRRALREFEQRHARLRESAAEEQRLREPARQAQQRLDRDRRARASTAALSAAAEAARARLLEVAEQRIERACRSGAVPPLWFWETFYPGPRPRPSGSWEQLASDVLAYRLAWGVHAPSPLGAEPQGEEASGGRLDEYRALGRRLADLDLAEPPSGEEGSATGGPVAGGSAAGGAVARGARAAESAGERPEEITGR